MTTAALTGAGQQVIEAGSSSLFDQTTEQILLK